MTLRHQEDVRHIKSRLRILEKDKHPPISVSTFDAGDIMDQLTLINNRLMEIVGIMKDPSVTYTSTGKGNEKNEDKLKKGSSPTYIPEPDISDITSRTNKVSKRTKTVDIASQLDKLGELER